ncbi:MAG: Ig-like domain-containing protein [bacterium]
MRFSVVAARAALSLSVVTLLAACGSDSSTGAKVGPAARVEIATAPPATSPVGGAGGTLAVRVVDATGNPVSGIAVAFAVPSGSAKVSPGAALTDASGLASTQITLGNIAGPSVLLASANGVATSVTVQVAGVAGPVLSIVVAPKSLRFITVGDTGRVIASAQDQYGNAAPASAFTFSVLDPTLVSVDAAGLIRVLKLNGTTKVVTSANGKSDTTVVTVLPSGSTQCTGLSTAIAMTVGEARTFSGAQYGCLAGTVTGAEFEMTVFNSSTDGTNALNVSATGSGLGAAPSPLSSLVSSGASVLQSVVGGPLSTATRQPDEKFHTALLRNARAFFAGRGASARSALAARTAVRRSVVGTPSAASLAVIPSSAQVGDVLTVNVSANFCVTPTNHGLRVTAVGAKSIILADTLNPPNGFVTADYQRFAARFDTLVYPLDVGAFGAPSDIDANGKVAIIFTRAVNELTPANAGYFVGGFFNPRDIYPKKGATTADDCPASNEGEMFYMLAPDPTGVVNSNVQTTGFVDSLTTGTIAHEFQHLINATRRLYVNNAPVGAESEDVWLNEGLSHIAEELLYYRESGLTPRQNLSDSAIRIINRPSYPLWKSDAANNFARFQSYLASPGANSPYANDDELATRGATWSFLRYAADRLGPTDGTIWQRFDNSVTTGLATLTNVLGGTPTPFFRDWAVANFIDDFGVASDPSYQHQSWNYRNIFTVTFLRNPVYPLLVTGLSDNLKSDFAVRGGSASYARFAVPAGKEALMTFSSGGGLPSAPVQFVVVRTK